MCESELNCRDNKVKAYEALEKAVNSFYLSRNIAPVNAPVTTFVSLTRKEILMGFAREDEGIVMEGEVEDAKEWETATLSDYVNRQYRNFRIKPVPIVINGIECTLPTKPDVGKPHIKISFLNPDLVECQEYFWNKHSDAKQVFDALKQPFQVTP